ncbi:hypothetical protein N657DRAFT_588019 [Parathielavia appendiculata]|uniref:Mitochondrial outer membrane transport complex Sam37/metaxin N-terminal domain-containing protein n=1 Tax=Parathielavia appendiculata TaxID=2587402 RepID=A0AAN6UBS5_9PEZI|nr:hypothetical protein N657DRAFT_588019 [Parathielavia appendiculata]
MMLQLYVWGPAFGLPSLDAECLAAIAFLVQTLSPVDYHLIQSSPSAVPTQHLPALHDPSTSTWTSGFRAIATHIQQTHPPPTFHNDHTSPPPPSPSSNPADTAPAIADGIAYTTFLTAHAAPLLSLSLYVSSANYASATRPAYSAVLPFPLPWTEPPAARAAMVRRAAHLGMSVLDTDFVSEEDNSTNAVVGMEGWVDIPAAVRLKPKNVGVGGLLSPEQKRRIRLEGLAGEVLDVLGEVAWERQRVEVRCLAWGYLALMLLPDVPRPWLREVMEGRYPGLCEFVREFRGEVFPEGKELPWVGGKDCESVVGVGARFARGVLGEVPLIGEQWTRWWAGRKRRQVMASKGIRTKSGGDLLLLLGAGLGLTAISAGVFFYRGLPPFGEGVQVWRKPVVTLSSFGAAGAMFSGALYGLD